MMFHIVYFQVEEVEVIMSNIHYCVADLDKLGLTNDKEVRKMYLLISGPTHQDITRIVEGDRGRNKVLGQIFISSIF